jgi:RimJ/RimL family protein N-acetyltransferase
MRLNYKIAIVGKHCILVPYRKEHVPKYHEWMQDPRLLESTGSEPLSLEAEYEMQASWRDDEFKCTFIVLDRDKIDEKRLETAQAAVVTAGCDSQLSTPTARAGDFIVETLSAMVGDVNLFFTEMDDDAENIDEENDAKTAQTTPDSPNAPRRDGGASLVATATTGSTKPRLQAEIDIMVAEHTSRSKGIGREAVVLMMQYASDQLLPGLRRFFCKINADNDASRTLFEKKLGFRQCNYAECFQQYEYDLKYQDELGGWASSSAVVDEESSSPLQILQCPVSNEEQ